MDARGAPMKEQTSDTGVTSIAPRPRARSPAARFLAVSVDAPMVGAAAPRRAC
jgi:hypothetical protein